MKRTLYIAIMVMVAGLSAFGQMTTFNGVDEYLTDTGITNNGAMTYSAWVKWDGVVAVATTFGQHTTGGANGGFYISIFAGDNYLRIHHWTSGADQYLDSPVDSIPIGEWVHIAISWDGTIGDADVDSVLYIDGVKQTSFRTQQNGSGTVTSPTGGAYIGVRGDLNAVTYFDGTIVNTKYFDRVLSDADVWKLYKDNPILDTDTVVDWSLNGKDGTPATDTIVIGQSGSEYYAEFPADDAAVINVDDTDQALAFGNGTTDSPFTIVVDGETTDVGTYNIPIQRGTTFATEDYSLFIDNNAKLGLKLADGINTTYIRGYSSSGIISVDTRYRMTVAYDGGGSGAGVDVYLDGIAQATTSDSSGSYVAMEGDATTITIGGVPIAGNQDWKGKLYDVKIFDGLLTSNQVFALESGTMPTNTLKLHENYTPTHVKPVLSLNKPAGLYAGGDTMYDILDKGVNEADLTNSGGVIAQAGTDWTISFDGASTFASTEVTASLPNDSTGSFGFWANVTDNNAAQFLLALSNKAHANHSLLPYFNTSSDDLEVWLYTNAGAKWRFTTTGNALTPYMGTMAHYCVVQNGTSPVLYINGVLITAVSFSVSTDTTAWFDDLFQGAVDADIFSIGGGFLGGALSNPALATVGDVFVSPTVLTSNQVLQIATGVTPSPSDGALYTMTPDGLFKNKGTAGSSADATQVGNPTVVASVPTVLWDESKAIDISGNDNHETSTGVVFSQEADDYVAYFADNGDYFTPTYIPNDSAGALGCWIKYKTPNMSNRYMTGGYSTAGGSKRTYLFAKNITGQIAGGFGNHDHFTIYGSTALVIDTWYHCVLAWDASRVYLYLNGILEYDQPRSGNASTTPILMSSGINADGASPGATELSYLSATFARSTTPTSNEVFQAYSAGRSARPSIDWDVYFNMQPLVKPAPKLNTGRNR